MAENKFEWDQTNARIETMVLIPAAISQGAFPDAFSETFCENLPEREDAPLYKQLPPMAQFATGDDWPDPEIVAETLAIHRANGFLIQAAQPVVSQFYPSGGFSYSWGYYHTEWLYAPTAADIETVVAAWSEETLAEDRAKSTQPGEVSRDAG